MITVPDSHLNDVHELESKGFRDLYQIDLRNAENTVLYFSSQNEVTYRGILWEALPCKLAESGQNSTGEQSRPKFTCANPDGLFSIWLQKGALDGAVFTRYRVMLPALEANLNEYIRNLWIVSKVLMLNKQNATLELRSIMDGVNYQLPHRSFYPPDFPHVSLQ